MSTSSSSSSSQQQETPRGGAPDASTAPASAAAASKESVHKATVRPINYRLAEPLVRMFLRLPVTPNQITTLNIAVGLFTGWLLSRGVWFAGVLAALGFQLCYILDNCDGEIARLKKMSSPWGGWYDLLADLIIHAAFFGGLAIGVHARAPEPVWAWLGWSAVIGTACCHLVVLWQKLRGFGPAAFQPVGAPRAASRGVVGRLLREVSQGDFSHVATVALVCNVGHWLLAAAAVGQHVYWIAEIVMHRRALFGPRRATPASPGNPTRGNA